ncbi:hypothetical protein P7K49_012157 [Saguinus oedipus]|uniref:Uncharacterized protein n=1 Tax=Saguinus oedipus TaxID=9490 RepID=A0ABQ9VTF3_SAGOE|nr:hypothetical protein P7K49_012157 [Saguinus oedipus]
MLDPEPAAWAPVQGLRDLGPREGLLLSASVWGGKQMSAGSPAQVRGAGEHYLGQERFSRLDPALGVGQARSVLSGAGAIFPPEHKPIPASSLVTLGLASTVGPHPNPRLWDPASGWPPGTLSSSGVALPAPHCEPLGTPRDGPGQAAGAFEG